MSAVVGSDGRRTNSATILSDAALYEAKRQGRDRVVGGPTLGERRTVKQLRLRLYGNRNKRCLLAKGSRAFRRPTLWARFSTVDHI
jgi:hypothetical protein